MVPAPIPLRGHRVALSSGGVRAEEEEEAGLSSAERVVAGALDGSQDPAASLRDRSSRWVTLIILLGSPPLMPTLPPALITDSFLEESVLSEQGSGYFLPKYILTFLCKEEADRDQRINSPTTCPSSLIRGI